LEPIWAAGGRGGGNVRTMVSKSAESCLLLTKYLDQNMFDVTLLKISLSMFSILVSDLEPKPENFRIRNNLPGFKRTKVLTAPQLY
jgi:hypothetical protein